MEAVDEGEEIGGVEQGPAQADLEATDRGGGDAVLNYGNSTDGNELRVVQYRSICGRETGLSRCRVAAAPVVQPRTST